MYRVSISVKCIGCMDGFETATTDMAVYVFCMRFTIWNWHGIHIHIIFARGTEEWTEWSVRWAKLKTLSRSHSLSIYLVAVIRADVIEKFFFSFFSLFLSFLSVSATNSVHANNRNDSWWQKANWIVDVFAHMHKQRGGQSTHKTEGWTSQKYFHLVFIAIVRLMHHNGSKKIIIICANICVLLRLLKNSFGKMILTKYMV